MPENLGEARLRLTADSRQLDSTLKRSRASVVGLGLAFTGIGLATTGAFAKSVQIFGEYEQSMAQVRAVSGATEDQFKALDSIAREMGRTTVFTARESAQALSFMSMAGLEAEQSIAALPDVLNLAAAGQLELGQSADIVTNVMAGYGIEADRVTHAVDVLTKGFTSANTDLVQLGEAFKLGGPVAKAAGLSFEETAAALSLMGNAGFQATLSGTALRGAITRLLNPTDENRKLLEQYGVEVLDSEGKMRSLVEIMRQFEGVGLTAADAMAIFGQRAGPAMLALLEQGSGALEELTFEMLNAAGTADRIARTQLDTFQGDITLLKSALEGLALGIGAVLVPALRDLLAPTTELIQRFTAWSEQNPDLTKRLVFLGVAIAGLALVFGTLLLAVGIMATGLAALASGPVILIIGAFAALVAGIGVAIWNFDSLRSAVDAVAPHFTELRETDLAALQTELMSAIPFQTFVSNLETMRDDATARLAELNHIFDAHFGVIKFLVVSRTSAMQSDFDMRLAAMRETAVVRFDEIEDTISMQMDSIQSVISTRVAMITDTFTNAFQTIGDKITTLKTQHIDPLGEAIADFNENYVTPLAAKFQWLRDEIIDRVAAKFDTLKSILIAVGVVVAGMLLPIGGLVAWIIRIVLWVGQWLMKFIQFEEVVEKYVKPALTWFTETIMPAIKDTWENVLRPAFDTMVDYLQNVLTVAINVASNAFKQLFGGEDSETSGSSFLESFQPVVDFLQNSLIPTFMHIANFVWPLIKETWIEHLKPTFLELMEFLKMLLPLLETIADALMKALAWIWEEAIIPLMKSAVILIEGIIGALAATIRFILNVLQGDWRGAWQSIFDFVEETLETIMGLLRAWRIDQIFGGQLDTLVNAARQALNRLISIINRFVSAWNRIQFRVPRISLPKATIGGGTFLGKRIPSVTVGGGSFGGQTFRVSPVAPIPMLAEGGIVKSPTLAMIGEAGPEAVVPLRDFKGGGQSVTIVIEGNVLDGDDFNEKVSEALLLRRRQGLEIG